MEHWDFARLKPGTVFAAQNGRCSNCETSDADWSMLRFYNQQNKMSRYVELLNLYDFWICIAWFPAFLCSDIYGPYICQRYLAILYMFAPFKGLLNGFANMYPFRILYGLLGPPKRLPVYVLYCQDDILVVSGRLRGMALQVLDPLDRQERCTLSASNWSGCCKSVSMV